MKPEPVFVELAGLPGSGKSSTVRHLTEEHATAWNAGLQKLGRRDALQHPFAITKQIMRWRSLSMQWSDKRAVLRVLRRRISQDLVSGKASSLVLFEEGITQYIWRTLFLTPDLTSEPWAPFLDVTYPLVALEADPALLRSRILAKEKGGPINERLGGLPAGSADWIRAEALFEETLTQASRYRQVVRVDAAGDVSSTADRIREVIRTYPGDLD
jgi:hypothetical protein